MTNNNNRFVITVGVHVGRIHESDDVAGASHLLEHILIDKNIAWMKFNGFTDMDHTMYYGECDPKHYRKAIKLFSDMLTQPLRMIKDATIKKEKAITAEESARAGGPKAELTLDLLYKATVYGSKAMQSIDGHKAIDRAMLLAFYKKYYANMTIVLNAPKAKQKAAQAYATRLFKNHLAPHSSLASVPFQCAYQRRVLPLKERIVIKQTHSPSSKVCFATQAFPYHMEEHVHACKFLKYMMQTFMSAFLIDELREKKQITYAVEANDVSYKHLGYLEIIFATSCPTKIVAGLEIIVAFVTRMQTKLLTSQELQWFKKRLVYDMDVYDRTQDLEKTIKTCIHNIYTQDEAAAAAASVYDAFKAYVKALTPESFREACRTLFGGLDYTGIWVETWPSVAHAKLARRIQGLYTKNKKK